MACTPKKNWQRDAKNCWRNRSLDFIKSTNQRPFSGPPIFFKKILVVLWVLVRVDFLRVHIFTTPITLIHHNHLWYCRIPANSTFCICKYQRHTIFFEFSLKIWIYTISPFHDDPITSISKRPFILCFVSALRSLLIWCFQPSFFISVVSGDYIQGRIQDFKLGGAHLKKIAPSGGKRENFWGNSCENSRFYAKKADYRISLLPLTSNSKNKTVMSKLHCMSNL